MKENTNNENNIKKKLTLNDFYSEETKTFAKNWLKWTIIYSIYLVIFTIFIWLMVHFSIQSVKNARYFSSPLLGLFIIWVILYIKFMKCSQIVTNSEFNIMLPVTIILFPFAYIISIICIIKFIIFYRKYKYPDLNF